MKVESTATFTKRECAMVYKALELFVTEYELFNRTFSAGKDVEIGDFRELKAKVFDFAFK